jgi:ADP-ribose pyrophosphatase YjhB (NUDIX family)
MATKNKTGLGGQSTSGENKDTAELTGPPGLSEKEFLENYDPKDFDQVSLAVDMVILAVEVELAGDVTRPDKPELKILLVKRAEHPYLGSWSLPGGFVGLNETLEQTGKRVTKSKTALEDLYLEQLYTFGEVERDPRARIISCSYLALMDYSQALSAQNSQAKSSSWFAVSEAGDNELVLSGAGERLAIPFHEFISRKGRISEIKRKPAGANPLAFDHAEIILEALGRIKGKIEYTDIIFNLMPDNFTLWHLQTVYEIVLGEKLIASGFRRKIGPKVVPTDEFVRDKKYRPSRLYRYRATDAN